MQELAALTDMLICERSRSVPWRTRPRAVHAEQLRAFAQDGDRGAARAEARLVHPLLPIAPRVASEHVERRPGAPHIVKPQRCVVTCAHNRSVAVMSIEGLEGSRGRGWGGSRALGG